MSSYVLPRQKEMETVIFEEGSWRLALFRIALGLQKTFVRGTGPVVRFARRRLGERYIRCSSLLGSPVWVCPNHSIGNEVVNAGTYEPSCMAVIKRFSQAGFSYVDVGSNIGLHLLQACESSSNPAAAFHGFEPEPRMFEVLSRNCERFTVSERVHLHAKAVGSVTGKASLFVSTTWNQGNHSLCPRPGNEASLPCEVTTLDSELGSRPEQFRKTLLKIDVEGLEVAVLKGAGDFLSQVSNLAVLCEASADNLARAGYTLQDLAEALRACGLTKGYEVRDDADYLIPWSIDRGFRGSISNVLLLRGAQAFAVVAEGSE